LDNFEKIDYKLVYVNLFLIISIFTEYLVEMLVIKSQNIDHFLFTYNLIYNILYIRLDLLVDVNNSIRILYKDIGLIKLGEN
jgi:hypothetical protein